MPLWRLLPEADPQDARWLDHRRWAEVVVRAGTAGEARRVAAAYEATDAPKGVGNETPTFEAGLSDEKLYRLVRLGPEEGPEGRQEGLSVDVPETDDPAGPSEVVLARRA